MLNKILNSYLFLSIEIGWITQIDQMWEVFAINDTIPAYFGSAAS